MNVNGKDITVDDMMVMLENLQSSWYNFMYTCISSDKMFLKDMPGTNYKKRQLIDELVEHFTETEEYERCAELVKLKKW
jgi:hypothetical protein